MLCRGVEWGLSPGCERTRSGCHVVSGLHNQRLRSSVSIIAVADVTAVAVVVVAVIIMSLPSSSSSLSSL